MASRFEISPLGGFNLGGALRGLGQDIRQKQREDEIALQRQQMQEAIRGAVGGEEEAMTNLFALNPELGLKFEQRNMQKAQMLGQERANQIKEVETDWGLRWRQAGTDEEREALKQEALANDLIDFDESDLSAGDSQANLAVNSMLYSNLGKDTYKQFFSEPKLEKGTFTIKDTPTGFLRLNSATGDVISISDSSKEAKQLADQEKRELDAQLKQSNNIFERSKKIRDRYDKKSGDFTKVRDAYDRIEASATDPSPAGDLALIFNYMKMLDPGSVVRESEFATAQNAASVPERVRSSFNRVLSGEKLSPKQRKDFVGRANSLMNKANARQEKDRDEAVRLGKQWGATEQDIFGVPAEQQEVQTIGRFQVRVKQ